MKMNGRVFPLKINIFVYKKKSPAVKTSHVSECIFTSVRETTWQCCGLLHPGSSGVPVSCLAECSEAFLEG